MKAKSTQSRGGVKGGTSSLFISPLQGQGTASLVGFGATPQLFRVKPIQREKSSKVAAAKRPAPKLRASSDAPPSCSFQRLCCVAQMARPNCLSFRHGCLFPQAGISRLRARVGGFAVAPDTPSQRSPMRLDFYRNISLRICRCNHALPQWICGCLKKGAGKAKWN